MIKNSILINGTHLYNWNSHTIINNTLNNKSIYYWKNKTNDIMPSGASQIILANCTGITIQNQNINNCSIGILLGFSSYSTIKNNTISNNSEYGIYLSSNSNYNTLYHNNFIENNKSSGDAGSEQEYFADAVKVTVPGRVHGEPAQLAKIHRHRDSPANNAQKDNDSGYNPDKNFFYDFDPVGTNVDSH